MPIWQIYWSPANMACVIAESAGGYEMNHLLTGYYGNCSRTSHLSGYRDLHRTLLHSGTIIDGTRHAVPRLADLLIEEGRIAEIGPHLRVADALPVDCSGLTVTPGFIDAHSHSDLQALHGKREKIDQGVTTEVVGNCGFSAYPATDRQALHEFANGILCGHGDWGWNSAKEYLAAAHVEDVPVHIASQVGHGTLRIAVAGNTQQPLGPDALQKMELALDDSLAGGACGFSTGLMYAPGSSAPTDELIRLCRVVALRGKTYSSHIRSYFSGLVAAVEEQLQLARAAGCRLQISHLQAVGRANWNQQPLALELIETAQRDGIDVAFDCYPYVAGSSLLTQILPQWTLDGGVPTLLRLLCEPRQRKQVRDATLAEMEWDWCDIYISSVATAENANTVGLSLEQISEQRGCAPVDVLLDVLVEERGDANMLCFNQSEDNLRETLTHPLSLIISDGFYVKGRPHPRLFGTFPFLLGEICRERHWMTLAEAIHKITDAPARRFDLKSRGRLEQGYIADITVFDAKTVGSAATYERPAVRPVGIQQVYRSGVARLQGRSPAVPAEIL